MRGTIKNSGCVSNAMYRDLQGRNKGAFIQETFKIGNDTYQKRHDGTCWRIENGTKTFRIKNAKFLELKNLVNEENK